MEDMDIGVVLTDLSENNFYIASPQEIRDAFKHYDKIQEIRQYEKYKKIQKSKNQKTFGY